MKIRILIPVYRPLPTDGERRAIANNVRLLAAYDVAFVAPEGLDMTPYAALAPEAEVVRVGEEWLGNGGLSLRRTAAFIGACRRYADRAAEYLAVRSHLYNEDVFWATVPDNFRYPTPEEALAFAFDTTPAYCYRLTGGRLPMGCHSWSKPRMYRFWRRFIP